jgi:RNA polymerase sigma factor (sigma-70 family)
MFAEKNSRSPIPPQRVHAAQQALVYSHSPSEGAVLELIVHCEKKITSFVLSKMRVRRIAKETYLHEDVTREVILVLLQSALLAYRAETDTTFDTYLFKITERVFARMLAKSERIAQFSSEDRDIETLIDCLQPQPNIEEEQLNRLHLSEALNKLSDKEREALLRYVFHGQTYQEIADTWKMPLSTAYRFIKSVLAKLRQELADDDPFTKEQYTK